MSMEKKEIIIIIERQRKKKIYVYERMKEKE
jgi:hypothetical protein